MGEKRTHTFTVTLTYNGKTKDGAERFRVPIKSDDYKFITAGLDEELLFFDKMLMERADGTQIEILNPRVSRTGTQGKYTPHYITIPYYECERYKLKKGEPFRITLTW